jgi:small subunit ribosomal protein S4e
MARHGNSRHLNRLASSMYPRVSRKTEKYLAKPSPGRHKLERSIALYVILRDKFGFAANANEARKSIKRGEVLINGKAVKDDKYPVGFGDVLTLVQPKEAYSVSIGRYGDIKLEKLEGKEQHSRTLKVVGKYLSKGSKVMLRLYDGSALPGSKEVKVNDSVILSGGKIKSVLKFESGAKCLIVKGTHASETGVIKEIKAGSATNVAAVKVEGSGGSFETPADNVMVVGA